jgi:hypothetical protein
MYSSPCWPPAARIVLLRGSTDGSERFEEIGSGAEKEDQHLAIPSKS